MASQGTTLCVVNTSGLDITDIKVSNIDNYDWGDDTNRPDHNFQGAAIPRNDSRCEHEELNRNANGVSFGMTLSFSNNTSLFFAGNQQDAFDKQDRLYPATGSATPFLQVYQTSGGGSNAMNIQTIQAPDNSGWMGELLERNPNVTVNQITMPGSHDAGMYTISRTTVGSQPEWAQTQSLDIAGQLRAGSRYFDLRLYYDGQQLTTGHFSADMGSFGPPLTEVLMQVRSFIDSPAAAKEAVFLKFSHTSSGLACMEKNSDMTTNAVAEIKSILGDVLYTTPDASTNLASLPLSTLAGKVCVVVDYEYGPLVDPAEGIFRYTDITPDNLTGTIPGLDVFDQYSDTDSLDDMRADQQKKLQEYGGYGKPYLFLMSWTLTGKFGKILDVQVLAGMANPWLPMFTTNARSGAIKPNIIYYDYVNPYLCRCIIETNA
ncbi:hypothetical protein [Azospirillum soli]|uniref:hypothetical protein n=1 Tax=Azospirillum soli TaxID=1304799 RepID=UPI001AE496A8|nr:hypothetical protein [Azospirillum soli]MBP2313218.1 1-phosphatidylinositol phosphodiesterase [Azospirillum soli]